MCRSDCTPTVSSIVPCTTTVVAVFVTTAFTFSLVVLRLFAFGLAVLVPRLGFPIFALSLILSTSFVLSFVEAFVRLPFSLLALTLSDSNHHGLLLDQLPWAWPHCRGYPSIGTTLPVHDPTSRPVHASLHIFALSVKAMLRWTFNCPPMQRKRIALRSSSFKAVPLLRASS